MRRTHLIVFRYSILLSILLGGAYSCREDFSDSLRNNGESTELEAIIFRAKGVFDGLSPDFPCVQARSIGGITKSVVVEPVWKDAFEGEDESYISIETNIRLSKPFHLVPKISYEAYVRTKDARYLNYLSRAVVLTEKRSGASDAFIMTILGSKEYMESHDFQLWEVSYFHIPEDFSGMILYYSLDGNFVNGWNIDKGRQIQPCTPVSREDANLLSRSGSDCYVVEVTNTYVDCFTYSGNTFTTYEGESFSLDWSQTVCGSPYTESYSYMVCNSGSTGSTGGYSPPPGGSRTKFFRFVPQSMSGDIDRFLNYMRDKDCVSRAILNTAEDQVNFEPVNLSIDPVQAPNVARYDPVTNTIFFHDKEAFSEKTMYEEFIHILQTKVYNSSEIERGAFNMEFEAKLLIDYISISKGSLLETDLQEIAYLKNDILPPLDRYLEARVELISNRFDANGFLIYMRLWKETTESAYRNFNMDSSVEPKLIKGIVNNLDLPCFN